MAKRHRHHGSDPVRGRVAVITTLAVAFIMATACGGGNAASPPGTTGAPGGGVTAGDGGSGIVASPNLQLVSALQPFTACDELLTYVKTAANERVGPYGLPSNRYAFTSAGRVIEEDGATSGVPQPRTTSTVTAPPTTAQSSSSRSSSNGATNDSPSTTAAPGLEHSETNVQEKGVDEPDTIKTDGHRVLAVSGTKMIYVVVDGLSPVTAGAIVLPGDNPPQLLVSGNHVLAISTGATYPPYTDQPDSGARVSYSGSPSTLLTLVDIADPGAMKILHSVKIDGTFVSARMVDGRARVVTSTAPDQLPFVIPSTSSPAAEEAALEANRKIIADSTIEDWLPQIQVGNGTTPETKPLLDCSKVQHPKTFSGFGTLAVVSVDVQADAMSPADAVGVMADGQTVYASKANLYVATPAYVDPPSLPTSGTTPTTLVPRAVPLEQKTSIHKFDITASGPAVYRASGDIEGTLLNQFAMSEEEGYLRVATTSAWSGCAGCATTTTSVRVVQEADGELKQVGVVGDMGHGEQVKAVRFVGKQGYVVTFRQTDPLYTLDLSTPTAPKVVGELKILGYSSYLHPVGDHLLIGIGRDATATGRETGTKVSLFDVSDLANPREVQSYALLGSSTEVAQDFHAFMYWEPTRLAVIPVAYAYMPMPVPMPAPCPDSPTSGVCATIPVAPPYPDSQIPFTGALGLTIDEATGIATLGQIVHPPTFGGGDSRSLNRTPPVDCRAATCANPTIGQGPAITRSMVVGDTLFTFSDNGLKSSDLTTLREEFWLPYP